MNLQLLIEQYIAYRQSLGEQQKSNGCTLRAFGHFIGAGVPIADVHPDQVKVFLAGTGPITVNWHIKLSVLRNFYQYAVSRGYAAEAPLPTVIPKRPPVFVPHIYSLEEMRRLLHTAKSDNPYRTDIRPDTMHTILLVFYSTGLRIQELINLDRVDVNFTESTMKVIQSKFGKTRLVPFGPQLHQALQDYCKRHPASPGENAFFTTRYGRRIMKVRFSTISGYFANALASAAPMGRVTSRGYTICGTRLPFIGLPLGIGRVQMCRSCSRSCPFISAMSISGPRRCT